MIEFKGKEAEVKEVRGIGEGTVPYIVRKIKVSIGSGSFSGEDWLGLN